MEAAREIQRRRFAAVRSSETRKSKIGASDLVCNADRHVAEVRQFCELDGAGESLVRAAMGQINGWATGYHPVLKLARTIADLAGSEPIEALQYWPKMT